MSKAYKKYTHFTMRFPDFLNDFIRKECYEKFKDIQDFDLPDICGKVQHTKIYVSEPLIVN